MHEKLVMLVAIVDPPLILCHQSSFYRNLILRHLKIELFFCDTKFEYCIYCNDFWKKYFSHGRQMKQIPPLKI